MKDKLNSAKVKKIIELILAFTATSMIALLLILTALAEIFSIDIEMVKHFSNCIALFGLGTMVLFTYDRACSFWNKQQNVIKVLIIVIIAIISIIISCALQLDSLANIISLSCVIIPIVGDLKKSRNNNNKK